MDESGDNDLTVATEKVREAVKPILEVRERGLVGLPVDQAILTGRVVEWGLVALNDFRKAAADYALAAREANTMAAQASRTTARATVGIAIATALYVVVAAVTLWTK